MDDTSSAPAQTPKDLAKFTVKAAVIIVFGVVATITLIVCIGILNSGSH